MSGAAGPDGGPNGLAIVDKPAGWTSHDVVARARRLLGTRKVGHGGTLDPDATGVLLLGVGRSTRLLRYLTDLDKSYTCEVILGVSTDTLDASGEVVATHDMGDVTPDAVRAAASHLTGDLLQVPPMVSAVRVGGRRLHELARQGIEVERAPRPVHVARFEVTPSDPSAGPLRYRAEVTCSSGTYVRVLAADLGAALGGGAHLDDLRRTAIGPFTLDDAVPLDALDATLVRSPADAVGWMPTAVVDAATATEVAHGRVLPVDRVAPDGGTVDGGPWRVLDADGHLLAVYRSHGSGRAKPDVVLVDADRR